jgi:hypothetical protein
MMKTHVEFNEYLTLHWKVLKNLFAAHSKTADSAVPPESMMQ